jgi:type II secretory pathway pseudopilin PulG
LSESGTRSLKLVSTPADGRLISAPACQPVRRLSGIRARLAREEGLTLVELMVAMFLMSVILAPLIGGMVSMMSAQARQANVVTAQEQARLALERMRKDIHCAHSVDAPEPNASGGLTLILNETNTSGTAECPGIVQTNSSSVQWCTVPVAGYTNRYRLYREDDPNTLCDGTQAAFEVDYLTQDALWTTPSCTGGEYPTVGVTFSVDVYPGTTDEGRYNLADAIALRNASPCS